MDPIVRTAVAAFGNKIVTTVTITYALDCCPQDPGSVGVFITLETGVGVYRAVLMGFPSLSCN